MKENVYQYSIIGIATDFETFLTRENYDQPSFQVHS